MELENFHGIIDHQASDGLARIYVTRNGSNGPVIVTSPNAQPLGKQHRFRQHVDPALVVAVVRGWLTALPEDYCLRPECRDQLAKHWQDLRDQLSAIPCIEAGEEVPDGAAAQ